MVATTSFLISVPPPQTLAGSDVGWLPDASWGPWYSFSDPSAPVLDGLPPVWSRPRLVAVDDAGRFIVAGNRYDNITGSACDKNGDGPWRKGNENLVVSRYLADGTIDRAFGSSGSVSVPQSSHHVHLTDLVVAGNDIYLSAHRETTSCGPMVVSPASPEPIVVRVTGSGVLDSAFGSQGVTTMVGAIGEVHLGELDGGAVGAFYGSTFVYLSRTGIVETDLRETLCSASEHPSTPGQTENCALGGRIAANGSTVALSLSWPRMDSRSMPVLFGRLKDGRLIPDFREGQTAIDVIDLPTQVDPGHFVEPGSGWLAWDSAGRLVSLITVGELLPVLAYADIPHARGLLSSRYVADPLGGWRLDRSYAKEGLRYTPLPFSGPERFWVNAMGIDSDNRPVAVGLWYVEGAEFSSQVALRLTQDGDLDPIYGTGGMIWLPGEMPFIFGKVALDNKDNQYFATAWWEFSMRSKGRALFQLGRINSKGRIQVNDGRLWRDTKQQSRSRMSVWVLDRLPSEATTGKSITVRARVTVDRGTGEAVPVGKGVRVFVKVVPGNGSSPVRVLAQGRTDRRGEVTLQVKVGTTGYYFVSAQHPRYVNAASGMTRIQIRADRVSLGLAP